MDTDSDGNIWEKKTNQELDVSMGSVDFLDVVLDANTKYVFVSSSHPPCILKSIPEGVSNTHNKFQ